MNREDPTPDEPGRSWRGRLRHPLWSMGAVGVAGLLFFYMHSLEDISSTEVQIHCETEKDKEKLLLDDFSLLCTAELTKGTEPVKACWKATYGCADGRTLVAEECSEVKKGNTSSVELRKSEHFPDWGDCVPTSFTVNDVGLSPLSS